MTEQASKSPFLVFQHVVDADLCYKIAADLRVQPSVDEDGVAQPVARQHKEHETTLFNVIKQYIPQIEKHFGIKYRGTERLVFQQFPVTNGQMAEQPHCENAVYKRKKWIRVNDRDLTGVIWLKDFNDAPPFDLKKHVYGGKLEFPVYNFGFQPQVGTMVVYPACERFISLTTSIQVGELQLVRFHICADGLWLYDPKNFPGDMRTWFNDVV
jgi:hypothetical protein